MARRSSIAAYVAMLSIGLAVGGHLDSMRFTASANAVPAEGAGGTVLPARAMALVDSGNHISQIAADIMPSAVHIQAIRVENERKVE